MVSEPHMYRNTLEAAEEADLRRRLGERVLVRNAATKDRVGIAPPAEVLGAHKVP